MPKIDQYSIDEAFIPFDHTLAVQAQAVGWEIHDRVKKWTRMPVRVGIGPTRTLAKLANWWAKRTARVLMLELNTPQLEHILELTPVIDIWGIGRRLAARLNGIGICNARQLRDMDVTYAQKLLTVVGQCTVLELKGIQCIRKDEIPLPRKTLINTRSFGRGITKKEDLLEALTMHCAIAGARLRAEKLEAGTLAVYMETSRHTEALYFKASADISLLAHTNITGLFIKAARQALDICYQPGHKFMKGGVILFDIQPEGTQRQMSLLEAFIPDKERQQHKLMRAMDKVNDKFGQDAVRYLAQGNANAFWHMQRNKMSGRYTTNWRELPKIKI